jgi:uncharacterized protein YndB with AHSA1/START domain
METPSSTVITVSEIVNAPLPKVWECFTQAQHITGWNFASDDWHCPRAENNFQEGGKLCWTMAAKDGSFSFDLEGIYTAISPMNTIAYTLADGRKVELTFEQTKNNVQVTEKFEAEIMNPADMQQAGWQAILTNFKQYVEKQSFPS